LTDGELRALCSPLRQELAWRKLSLQQIIVANRLIDLSFALGRPAARIQEQAMLARSVLLDESDVSKRIGELTTMRILRAPTPEGLYELLPDPRTWAVGPRWRTQAQHEDARLAFAMLRHAQGIEQLDNGLASEPGLFEALGQVSREAAAIIFARDPRDAEIFRRDAASSVPLQTPASAGSREVALSPPEPAGPGTLKGTGQSALGTGQQSLREQIAQSLLSTGEWKPEEIERVTGTMGDCAVADGGGATSAEAPVHPYVERVGDSPTARAADGESPHREWAIHPSAVGESPIPHVTCRHVNPASQGMLHVPRGGKRHVGSSRGHVGARRKGRLPRMPRTTLELEIEEEIANVLDPEPLEFGPGDGKYGDFWRVLIEDCPRAARAAAGETLRMKKEQLIQRSVGGTLKWQYFHFRAELEKASYTAAGSAPGTPAGK
jgi:hypothetical protein